MSSVQAHARQRFGHEGVKVVVTGGSRGIGKAIVEEFAQLGAQVFTCCRTQQMLDDVLKEWRQEELAVQGCVADVSSEAGRAALMTALRAHFNGELHVLVNNVGTNIRKPTIEYTADDLHTMLQANLCSAFHLSQLCQPLLASTHAAGASIIFVSSVSGGPLAMKSGPVYAMTKAAMNQLTKNLACEWARANIRVNCVAPWYIHTELADAVLDKPEYKQNVLSRTPMNRIGHTEEVAGVVTFLASNAASYITGQTIAIDGGYSVMGLQ